MKAWIMASENPQPTRSENSPQLELEQPLWSFKTLVLTPDILSKGNIEELKICTIRDTGHELNTHLRSQIRYLTLPFEQLQILKALGLTLRIETPACVTGLLSAVLIEGHKK